MNIFDRITKGIGDTRAKVDEALDNAKLAGGKLAEETASVTQKLLDSAAKVAAEKGPGAMQMATDLTAKAAVIADAALKQGAVAAKEFHANVVNEAPSAGETLRTAGRETLVAISNDAKLLRSGNSVREHQLSSLRSRGLFKDDPTAEFMAIATYKGGHPDHPSAVAGGVLLIRPDDITWTYGDLRISIAHKAIHQLEQTNFVPSAARSMLAGVGSQMLRKVKGSVVVTCTLEAATHNIAFQFEGTMTVFGYEAVASDFINHMAKHRAKFTSSQSPHVLQSPRSTADEIGKLADLHARGVLTDQEFSAAKQRLLEP